MGYMDITPGKKTARIINARIITSEKGTAGLEVAFKFKEGETDERIMWVGWLTPDTDGKQGALRRTMKTAVEILGYNGSLETDHNDYLLPGTLDENRDVELVIEHEEYNGKSRPRVKWVNDPNVAVGFDGLSANQARHQLEKVGFRAAFLEAQAAFKGHGSAVSAPTTTRSPAPVSDIEVPF